MARLSHVDYNKKLESIRTAILRQFTDEEICTAESISSRQLRRYKRTIRLRSLKALPETSEEQKLLFLEQVQRWLDVIRQANRRLMSAEMVEGRVSAAPLLRVINEATKHIVDYSQKAGILPLSEEARVVKVKLEMAGLGKRPLLAT